MLPRQTKSTDFRIQTRRFAKPGVSASQMARTAQSGARMDGERGAAAGSGPSRIGAYGWYALLVLVLVYAINFIDRQIISILAQDIKHDLAVDDAQIGFLYG